MTAPREPVTEPCPECGTLCTIELHKLHVHYTPVLAVPAGDTGPGLRAALRRADDLIGELHAAAFDDADLTDSAHERRYVVERAAIAALAANPTTARDAEFTAADASRMEELATAADHRRLTAAERAEREELVDRWTKAYGAALRGLPVATASTGPTGLDADAWSVRAVVEKLDADVLAEVLDQSMGALNLEPFESGELTLISREMVARLRPTPPTQPRTVSGDAPVVE